MTPTILVIGTFDTKEDELGFIRRTIEGQGGAVIALDVSVLGDTATPVEIGKHEVVSAAGTTIAALVAADDEAAAMDAMGRGAAVLAAGLVAERRCHGVIALGGTMGTDLALDVMNALPLGLPKCIVSTVAFSPLIPPERLPADIQMILWAGGLYGLNDICRSVLAQAAGAVLGAARTALDLDRPRPPLVGMTSLGSTCLRYMKPLRRALGTRGFELAVFHSSGMGGRAFEQLATTGSFACAMDLCLQEFANALHGSTINSGPTRMRGADAGGIPQIIAPGMTDVIDVPTWQPVPERFAGLSLHTHNKLIASILLDTEGRRKTALAVAERINAIAAPVHVVLPLAGIGQWDRPGGHMHAPDDLAVFMATLQDALAPNVAVTAIEAHINDDAFATAVLDVFDGWCADGTIRQSGQEMTA